MVRALFVLMVLAGAAHAQPGQAAGPPLAAAAPAAESVMSRRWAVGLAIGSETLRAKTDGAPRVTFGVLELAGRFRVRPHIELGLVLGGGGAAVGKLSTGMVLAEFRYRFWPERPWNFYALAAIGAGAVSAKDAPDIEKKGRGALRFGGGAEYRLRRFAFDAELRLMGFGENPDVPDPAMRTTNYEMARYGVAGVAVVLGSTFYF